MLKNYILVTLRQLWKHKLFSTLNIFGLATSMSVCLLLIMVLTDQYGYDLFHENKDRIFRVISSKSDKSYPIQKASFATTALSLSEKLQEAYPFIEQTTRIAQVSRNILVDDKKFEAGNDLYGYAVDPSFLDIFSFNWIEGDQRTALFSPRSVVLTEESAKQFFPYSDPLGKEIELEDLGAFTVTGILPEPPKRSHLRFDFLFSFSTITEDFTKEERQAIGIYGYDDNWRGHVYTLLKSKKDEQNLDKALAVLSEIYSEKDPNHNYLFETQAMMDVRPSKDLSNDLESGTAVPAMILRFLMVLGIIIIVAACFNYMNLSIARSVKRAKEIGIRKVAGASRGNIIFQFLGEAVVIALFALAAAVLLLELLIPAFLGLDPIIETSTNFEKNPFVYFLFFLFSLVVGLLAGLFPAFNISAFQPIDSMKQLSNIQLFKRVGIRKFLIATQFTLSLIFILAVIILLTQQREVLNTDLGLKVDNMYNVYLEDANYDVFAQEVSQIKGVEGVSGSSYTLLSGQRDARMVQFNNASDSIELSYIFGTNNYIENMEIELVAGKGFEDNINSKGEQFILLNEKAVERMGYGQLQEALGKTIQIDDTTSLLVSGIVKDFNHDNIWWEPIQPFGIRHKLGMDYKTANIQINGADVANTIKSIQTIWKNFNPTESMSAQFMDDQIYHMSRFFTMGSKIIGFVGTLTILISCLGLLGMVLYTVESKVKEVGIRKVLGASEGNIIWNLSKGFLILLGIAILIAVPITFFGTKLWLQNFVIRMQIGPSIFLLGICIILVLGLVTVVSQTYLAAKNNPVDSLRQE